jgi:hypothetical protein
MAELVASITNSFPLNLLHLSLSGIFIHPPVLDLVKVLAWTNYRKKNNKKEEDDRFFSMSNGYHNVAYYARQIN